VSKIFLLSDADIRAMIDDELVLAHRRRALNPDHPFIRGTAQNPDVYFQGRETVNPFYDKTPGIVQAQMDKFAKLTGGNTGFLNTPALPMPSGWSSDGFRRRNSRRNGQGSEPKWRKNGCAASPLVPAVFDPNICWKPCPPTVRAIAVLDRTKEPGATGEPLYQDVVSAFMEAHNEGQMATLPRITGGRYGLSSKEFTPAMVKAVFDELKKPQPKNHFTVGIRDDVGHTQPGL
jgi:pyruvate-ferredoxin/flavodoxin oxidoreductase